MKSASRLKLLLASIFLLNIADAILHGYRFHAVLHMK